MNLTPKAALKPPALQTLRAGAGRPELAAAFGVRASLAPLFRRRSPKVRFRGLRREPLREILSPRRRSGERIEERIPRSPDSRLKPLNRKGKKPQRFGADKDVFSVVSPSLPVPNLWVGSWGGRIVPRLRDNSRGWICAGAGGDVLLVIPGSRRRLVSITARSSTVES